jgi:hypothetical protein
MELSSPHDRGVPPDGELVSGVSTAAFDPARVTQLTALLIWSDRDPSLAEDRRLVAARQHLEDAERTMGRHGRFLGLRRREARMQAAAHLNAAEADLLSIAPDNWIRERMPGLVLEARRHLDPADPQRADLETLARSAASSAAEAKTDVAPLTPRERLVVVAAKRAASDAALRSETRIGAFRKLVLATTALMALVAIGLAMIGLIAPDVIPLCFTPESSGEIRVVCPTAESDPVPAPQTAEQIDELVAQTAGRFDILLVEVIGLTAAAVALARATRGIRGSAEPHGLVLAVGLLKLPAGAVTAALGLLLMSAQFVPGFGALDTSAQILAWAIVLGYAQQLFTRQVDQQAAALLDATGAPYVAGRRISPKAMEQLEQGISGAVEQSVRTALAPPRLVNIEGRLSAAWDRGGATWRLHVRVQTGPGTRAIEKPDGSRPFRLVGGEPGDETQLEVSVDLPGHVVDVGDRTITIGTTGDSYSWFGTVDPAITEPREAWISITTHGRFLQAVATEDGEE